MNFEVTDQNLKKVGSVDLNDDVFGVKSKPYLWHEMVKWQLARKRQGTAKTKQRNEVSGTTKKLYRQKGTGQARHGSSKAPIFIGGGQTFGPIPRSYDYNIPKQTKRLAICSALSMKKDKSFFRVIDEIKMSAMKTKEAVALLTPFAFKSALIIDTDNANLHKAVRNLKSYKFVKPEGLNIYDLMKFEGLIVTKSSPQQVAGDAKRMNIYEILKRPLLTEKSNIRKSDENQVAFEVNFKADKGSIKKAVETLFKVKVESVNTCIVHGKVKTVGRVSKQRPNWKKAVVTLKEGQNIEFVEGV